MTRFATASRAAAAAVLIAFAVLVAIGLPVAPRLTPLRPIVTSPDLRFYASVVSDVRSGRDYEEAAVARQRAAHFPLRPFFTVRPPALAVAQARFPGRRATDLTLAALALVVIAIWVWRLRGLHLGAAWLVGVALTMAASLGMEMGGAGVSYLHEAWAGLLMALSLALRSERRFGLAVAFGLLAALIRELAIPYLVVMAVFALIERRRGEAFAFGLALVAVLIALKLHAADVISLTSSRDLASPGWVAFGGWGFVLQTTRWSLLVIPWVGAAIAPLALLGAAGWRDATGLRLFGLLAGYAAGFLVLGRPENVYWGLMTTPLIGVGLCMAPDALADLVLRVRGARPGPAQGAAIT
jgi:hypothetical protein